MHIICTTLRDVLSVLIALADGGELLAGEGEAPG